MKGFKLALGTLTIIPVGELGTLDRKDARRAMLLAPVASLPLAGLVVLLLWLSRILGLPPLLTGLLSVGIVAYGTRAMHLDGLADTVDGFGAGWTRERAHAVMKSGDIGPMGVMALVVSVGIQAVATAALIHHPWLVGLALAASRVGCTVLAAAWWQAARPEGMGSLMAGAVPRTAAVLCGVTVGSVFILAAFCSGLSPWQGGVAGLLVLLAWGVLGQRATAVFGGISGDIFGAAVEIGYTILLTVLSAGVSG